jgi:hypothetical protein
MAKNKLVKNISVNELAVMMKNSFDAQTKLMADGFDGVNKNFESVNDNFKKVFGVLKVMDDKLDDVGTVKHRVDYIEGVLNISALPAKKI